MNPGDEARRKMGAHCEKAKRAGETSLPAGTPAGDRPSRREVDVMRLLADGNSSKQIAAALHLSTRTVETYRARIMIKLNMHSVAEIVRYAVRTGIVEP